MRDAVTLRTDKVTYRAGETVKLRLVNTSSAQYTYNPCQRIIERDSSGTWTEVREERMCTMIAHLLEPGKTNDEETEMAEKIAPGRYRLVIVLNEESPGASRAVRAVSDALTVGR
jgi:hypothetical protein